MNAEEERWTLVARISVALCLLAGAAWFWPSYGPLLVKRYQYWRYPPIRAKSPLGLDMKRNLEAVRRAEVRGQYDRVKALLDKAGGEGLPVGELYGKLPTAVRMIANGQFEYARVHLSSIEARIPRKPEPIAAAGAGVSVDDGLEMEEPEREPPPPPRRKTPAKAPARTKGSRR
ncbi:MAG: hypothetical protein HYZ75_15080 [Elusimicrobia bacterium]|nr:hypothetical protein [Elusimicrobiota bacterium]